MAQLNLKNIHPLLQKPEGVSIAYRDQLAKARDEIISGLTDQFTAQRDQVAPAFEVTMYYYSDNGGPFPDTARKEVQSFLHDSANAVSILSGIIKPTIVYDDTPAQSWPTSGFELAQTTRYSMGGVGNVTFLNCAPRIDERGQDGNKTNKGEPIYIGILPNGHVVTANSRYNLTYFRDMVENGTIEFFEANVQTDGTQFRSRDIFPTYQAVLTNLFTQNIADWKPDMSIEKRRALLGKIGIVNMDEKLELDNIPALKPFTIAHVDVHGNIKLNTRSSEIDPAILKKLRDEEFTIKIGDRSLRGCFTQRMFDRPAGAAGLSVGSSGSAWSGAAHDDGFLEISIIGESASEALGIDPAHMKQPIEIEIPGIFNANDNTEPQTKHTPADAQQALTA